MTAPCCESHRGPSCCDPLDCGPCCADCPTCPVLIRERQPHRGRRARRRLADWLLGGEVSALRVRVAQGERSLGYALDDADLARDAARRTQGRLAQVLRADVTRERQVRAVHLVETLLDRFRERGTAPVAPGVAVATVDASTLAAWHSLADELGRPAPQLDAAVADREPDQPAIVHPPTDSVATCGEWVRECGDLDCGGCSCFRSAPCHHCMEHTCTRAELHDGEHEYDPEVAHA